jgi:dTDP-4-dehydrorhamnose reductase
MPFQTVKDAMNKNNFAKLYGEDRKQAGSRVMVLGSRGTLGQQFLELYPEAVTPLIDIAEPEQVRQAMREHRPEVVINCAGRCGTPNVDWCEDHKLETLHANVTGALILLEECERQGAYLVHMSSGCIYAGDNNGKGFSEDDAPNFTGSFYSRTKAWADQIFREFPVLTLRLRMPFDGSLNERNLLMKLRRYRRVLTAPNSLTCLPHFLGAAERLIEQRATGVFNVVNPGVISPFEIMTMYRDIVDPVHEFEPLPMEHLGEVARAGRSNCTLDGARLEEQGIFLPLVHGAVEEALGLLALKLSQAGQRVSCLPV